VTDETFDTLLNNKTMKTFKLVVPTMKSPHCQRTVQTVAEAAGAAVTRIEPTRVEFQLGEEASAEAVIASIRKAGYTVQEYPLTHPL
jgi:copper chaperone CopZ